jgi:hypothetical protein
MTLMESTGFEPVIDSIALLPPKDTFRKCSIILYKRSWSLGDHLSIIKYCILQSTKTKFYSI